MIIPLICFFNFLSDNEANVMPECEPFAIMALKVAESPWARIHVNFFDRSEIERAPSNLGRRCPALALQDVEGDVDDHVFLAADHAAAAELDQDGAGVEAVILGRGLGVAQEAGIDANFPRIRQNS
jgi:hypothetical protein